MAPAEPHFGPGMPSNVEGDDNYWRQRQRRRRRQHREIEHANMPFSYCASSSADQLEFKRKRRRDWTWMNDDNKTSRISISGGSESRSPADGRDNGPATRKPSTIEEKGEDEIICTTATNTTVKTHKSLHLQVAKLKQRKIDTRVQSLVANVAPERASLAGCTKLRAPARRLIVLSLLLLSLFTFIFIPFLATQPGVSFVSKPSEQHQRHHHSSQYQPDRRYFITFASANEIMTSAASPPSAQLQDSNNNLLEPQAMAYNLLHELGSGEGPSYPRDGFRSGRQRQTFTDASSSVSPSLIEARCWNNYETDNDCKLLNVITGPSGGDGSMQNQHKQHQQQLSADDSDNIITPVVIFEASSTIEPQQASSYQDDLFGGRQYFAQPPTRQSSPTSSSRSDDNNSNNNNSNNNNDNNNRDQKDNNQYRTNYQQQQTAPSSPMNANDFYSGPPQAATILPTAGHDRPVTRPSVANSRIFVATPSPSANKKAAKTTTMGRKCRDENDADCDEPDDGDDSLGSSASVNDIDNEDDNRDGRRQFNGSGEDSSRPFGANAGGSESIEPGSGGGAPFSPTDDNDDSTDDGDDDNDDGGDGNGNADDDSSNDDNGATGGDPSTNDGSLDEGSGDSIDPSQESAAVATPANSRFLEVTSISPRQSSSATTTGSAVSSLEQDLQTQRTTTAPPVTRPTPTHRIQTGAEIEVVVHSTLPPSFPSTTRQTTAGDEDGFGSGGSGGGGGSSSSSTTTTTPMPDETFTSKPIFPSSTSASSLGSQSEEDGLEDDQQSGQAGGSSTTEIDLYTFKPIPIPVEQNYPDPAGRPSRFDSNHEQAGAGQAGADQQQGSGAGAATDADQQQQGGGVQEVSAQHIHEPAHRKPSMVYDGRGTFDDGWTTRRPLRAHSQLAQNSAARDAVLQQQQQQQMGGPLDSFMMPGKRTAASKTHIGTDMLPTLLLYASIIILVTTALIFVVMAYVFWRRNTIRRRTLLQKAHMLDRGQPAHMIQSMSHASQLIHGNGNLGGGAAGGALGAGGPAGHMQPGLLSTYAPGKGLTVSKVTTSLAKPGAGDQMRMLRNDADDGENDGDDDEDDDGASDRLMNNKANSKDQLVGDGNGGNECGASGADGGGQRREGQVRRRLNNGGPLTQSSGSTDEPTTSSGGGGSSSQQTQDSQQQLGAGPMGPSGQQQQQQQYQGQVKSAHYPNSLSDGRQNSSSISDSQCSPDTSIGGPQQHQVGPPSPMHPNNNNNNSNLNHHPMSGSMPHQYQQQMQMGPGPQTSMVMGPMYPPQAPTPFRPMYIDGNSAGPRPGALGSPLIGSPSHRLAYPMNVGPQNGFSKPRFVTSRSIEDIPHAMASQHVGFVHPIQQQQVLYHQSPTNMPPQQHVMLPQLIQHRPTTQFPHQQQVNYQQLNPQLGSPMHQQHQQMISAQRIAMNPLATLSRRYPPGTGLNRTIYSEDSSSFMTASPSLARTSSSSSFAFNMSKQHSVSSIKAKPIVDASGRVTNDYTAQANFDGLPPPPTGQQSNGNGTGGPPVFGLSDRSEAWYV